MFIASWPTIRLYFEHGRLFASTSSSIVRSAQQKELVILRTGYRWASEYEWAHHVARGLMAGLSRERIARAAVAAEDTNDGNDEDGVLIRATDDLLDNGRLSQSLLTSLQGYLSQAAIIDLMATIGMYTTLAFLVNSFDTPIDAGIASPGVNAADN